MLLKDSDTDVVFVVGYLWGSCFAAFFCMDLDFLFICNGRFHLADFEFLGLGVYLFWVFLGVGHVVMLCCGSGAVAVCVLHGGVTVGQAWPCSDVGRWERLWLWEKPVYFVHSGWCIWYMYTCGVFGTRMSV